MLDRFRRARLISLPLAPLLVAIFGWFLVKHRTEIGWLDELERTTRGFVTGNFVLSALAIVIVVLVILVTGRIRLDDVGVNRDYLGRGAGVVAMIWGAAQIIGVLPRVVANRPVLLDSEFEYGSRWEMGGQFLAALGNATLGEIVFRGFLLVQLYLLFNAGDPDEKKGTWWATGLTVVAAALTSLPRTLPYPSLEIAALDQASLLLGGIFLCWLYLRTRNLFFVIGVHALLVAPSPIVAGPQGGGAWYQPLIVAILATLWALLWPRRD